MREARREEQLIPKKGEKQKKGVLIKGVKMKGSWEREVATAPRP